MKREIGLLIAAVAVLSVGSLVSAQGPAGERGERGERPREGGPGGERRGPGGFLRRLPMMQALDLNKDGELGADEIAKASASLITLDKNKDGKLTEDELRPSMGGGPNPGPTSAELVARLLEFDANKDGKLSKSEAPGRLQGIFERADTNRDGFLTREELTKYAESLTPPPPAPSGAERGR
jgi:Ca2+-binding EF-hand superfamily protein